MYVIYVHIDGAASAHRWHLCGGTKYLDMAPFPFRVYRTLVNRVDRGPTTTQPVVEPDKMEGTWIWSSPDAKVIPH